MPEILKLKTDSNIVCLSLGTNLGDKRKNFRDCLYSLHQIGFIKMVFSSVYETAPWGVLGQDNYWNMAISLETELAPTELLATLQEIETSMGRKGKGNWAPRVIDIDILFYGSQVLNLPGLGIPHLLLHKRRFVLEPLAEIMPLYYHPVLNKTVMDLLNDCTDKTVVMKLPLELDNLLPNHQK